MKCISKVRTNDLLFCTTILSLTLYTIIQNIYAGIVLIFLIILYFIDSCKSKATFITSLIFLFAFQMISKDYSKGIIYIVFNYIDELLVILFGIYVIINIGKKNIKLEIFEKKMLLYYSGFCMFCLISNLNSRLQGPIPIAVDFITCIKLIVTYLFARVFYEKKELDNQRMEDTVMTKCKFLALLFFVLSILNILIPNLYERFDYRYFMHSIQLFFPHPSYLVSTTIILIILMLYYGKKGNYKYILMLSIVTIFSLRVKAIATLFSILIFYIGYYKLNIRYKSLWIVLILIFGLCFAYDQIQVYYNNNQADMIRERMTKDGIQIANESFPLGTGFATFGSSAAFQFDSQLYYKFGYFTSKRRIETLGDTFWPIVIAQSGWIGTMFFVLSIYQFIKFIFKKSKNNALMFCAALSIFIYELIGSIAETAFFNPMVSGYFMVLGVILTDMIKNSKISKPQKNYTMEYENENINSKNVAR